MFELIVYFQLLDPPEFSNPKIGGANLYVSIGKFIYTTFKSLKAIDIGYT